MRVFTLICAALPVAAVGSSYDEMKRHANGVYGVGEKTYEQDCNQGSWFCLKPCCTGCLNKDQGGSMDGSENCKGFCPCFTSDFWTQAGSVTTSGGYDSALSNPFVSVFGALAALCCCKCLYSTFQPKQQPGSDPSTDPTDVDDVDVSMSAGSETGGVTDTGVGTTDTVPAGSGATPAEPVKPTRTSGTVSRTGSGGESVMNRSSSAVNGGGCRTCLCVALCLCVAGGAVGAAYYFLCYGEPEDEEEEGEEESGDEQ